MCVYVCMRAYVCVCVCIYYILCMCTGMITNKTECYVIVIRAYLVPLVGGFACTQS